MDVIKPIRDFWDSLPPPVHEVRYVDGGPLGKIPVRGPTVAELRERRIIPSHL